MEKYLIEENTLTAIGNAIRDKDGSTDLIPVVDMASRISNIPSGRRATTGTITIATAARQVTVTHNLGVIPSCVMLYPKDLSVMAPYGTEEAKGKAYKFAYIYSENGGLAYGFCYGASTSTGNYSFSGVLATNVNTKASITDTTFTTGTHGQSYYYQPDIEYEWIAIE